MDHDRGKRGGRVKALDALKLLVREISALFELIKSLFGF